MKQAKQAEHLALAAELLLGSEYFARQANEEDPYTDRFDNLNTDHSDETDSAHHMNANNNSPTFKNSIKILNNYNKAVSDLKYGHKWCEAIHAEL